MDLREMGWDVAEWKTLREKVYDTWNSVT